LWKSRLDFGNLSEDESCEEAMIEGTILSMLESLWSSIDTTARPAAGPKFDPGC
jgi:hypothetical protein